MIVQVRWNDNEGEQFSEVTDVIEDTDYYYIKQGDKGEVILPKQNIRYISKHN
jgi:hypothetical protein